MEEILEQFGSQFVDVNRNAEEEMTSGTYFNG
jgi:hypothetical protein